MIFLRVTKRSRIQLLGASIPKIFHLQKKKKYYKKTHPLIELSPRKMKWVPLLLNQWLNLVIILVLPLSFPREKIVTSSYLNVFWRIYRYSCFFSSFLPFRILCAYSMLKIYFEYTYFLSSNKFRMFFLNLSFVILSISIFNAIPFDTKLTIFRCWSKNNGTPRTGTPWSTAS